MLEIAQSGREEWKFFVDNRAEILIARSYFKLRISGLDKDSYHSGSARRKEKDFLRHFSNEFLIHFELSCIIEL